METKILQITSGRGPAECCLAVALTLKEILKEAKENNLACEVINRTPYNINGTLASASVKISGKNISPFINSWQGVLGWICQSPFRTMHKRKNWFIGIEVYDLSSTSQWSEKDVYYQTLRSSGPGGQNVNKVETAVRAVHKPSGVQVLANESRSQMQNKKIALERLKELFIQWQLNNLRKTEKQQWQNHNCVERGNPKRIYKGINFKKEKIGRSRIN